MWVSIGAKTARRSLSRSLLLSSIVKVVKGPHRFKGVVVRVRDTPQALEDLLAELDLRQNHLLLLNEQRKQLAEQNKENPLLDKEMQKTKEKAALLKNQIRGLGS